MSQSTAEAQHTNPDAPMLAEIIGAAAPIIATVLADLPHTVQPGMITFQYHRDGVTAAPAATCDRDQGTRLLLKVADAFHGAGWGFSHRYRDGSYSVLRSTRMHHPLELSGTRTITPPAPAERYAYEATCGQSIPLDIYTTRAEAQRHAEDFAHATFSTGVTGWSWHLDNPDDGQDDTDTPHPEDSQTLYATVRDDNGRDVMLPTAYRIIAHQLQDTYDPRADR
ncbi:hypothetical protein ABTX81_30465 [Kitasatospora sp. NPDC097605]|uniref:hypothetical protein n=1 Tax=Kitasatospora sp. NPDC097605 TaxID=3157226 RepID=UPI00331882C4